MFNMTFQMPSGEERSRYEIGIKFDRRLPNIYDAIYTYLANPEVTRVAANSSIERSVREMQPATMALWEEWSFYDQTGVSMPV